MVREDECKSIVEVIAVNSLVVRLATSRDVSEASLEAACVERMPEISSGNRKKGNVGVVGEYLTQPWAWADWAKGSRLFDSVEIAKVGTGVWDGSLGLEWEKGSMSQTRYKHVETHCSSLRFGHGSLRAL